jgi:hypothetical protein
VLDREAPAGDQRKSSSSATARLAYAGVAVVALLAVVALASRGHQSPAAAGGVEARAPARVLVDIVFTLAVLGAAAMVVGLAYLRARASAGDRDVSFRSIITIVLVFAAVALAAVLLARQLGEGGGERSRTDSAASAAQDANGRKRAERPEFDWLVAAGTVSLVLAAFAVVTTRRIWRRRGVHGASALAAELARVLDEGVDDLLAEPDPRRAVIAAYARMERALAAHGLPRRKAEAPLEYLARVLLELRASESAVRDLTALFERAKFSRHPVGPEMKGQAIAALVSVRDDLRAVNALERPAARLPAEAATRP